jgi:SprT protein
MVLPLNPQQQRTARRLLRNWSTRWGVEDLAAEVQIGFDPRLSRSLGRCRPKERRITLHCDLMGAPPGLFATVLCHEAAHVVAYQLFGRAARPHGLEWSGLVEAAGFVPTHGLMHSSSKPRANLSKRVYRHSCPVCQESWLARRPVRAWRCPNCVSHGLDGELMIERPDDD